MGADWEPTIYLSPLLLQNWNIVLVKLFEDSQNEEKTKLLRCSWKRMDTQYIILSWKSMDTQYNGASLWFFSSDVSMFERENRAITHYRWQSEFGSKNPKRHKLHNSNIKVYVAFVTMLCY